MAATLDVDCRQQQSPVSPAWEPRKARPAVASRPMALKAGSGLPSHGFEGRRRLAALAPGGTPFLASRPITGKLRRRMPRSRPSFRAAAPSLAGVCPSPHYLPFHRTIYLPFHRALLPAVLRLSFVFSYPAPHHLSRLQCHAPGSALSYSPPFLPHLSKRSLKKGLTIIRIRTILFLSGFGLFLPVNSSDDRCFPGLPI